MEHYAPWVISSVSDVIQRPERRNLVLHGQHLPVDMTIHSIDVVIEPRIHVPGELFAQLQAEDTEKVYLIAVDVSVQVGISDLPDYLFILHM